MKYLKLFENFGSAKFFRAEPVFKGDAITIEPDGYYEAIDEDGDPEMEYGEFSESEIAEVCAANYIGGAVLGSYSMNRDAKTFYIYETDQQPDVDITHWTDGDFEFIGEVRYRDSVSFKFVKKVTLTPEQNDMFMALYERLEDYEGESESDFDVDDLHSLLKNIR
jgi:hypothetical protein